MPKISAGILLWRRNEGAREILLVHPGGPLWARRDAGAWQIPKGLVEPGEEPAAAAKREVEEELGIALTGTPLPLCRLRQKGGKTVHVFALEQAVDADMIRSNLFEMEWPPRSGRMKSFPEIDRARWMRLAEARAMMLESQHPALDAFESAQS